MTKVPFSPGRFEREGTAYLCEWATAIAQVADRAAREDCARWHDEQVSQICKAEAAGWRISKEANTEREVHRRSAAAIRAKQGRVEP